MRSWRSLLVLVCACKAELGGTPPIDPDGPNSPDAAIDAVPDALGTFAPWSTPLVIPPASTGVAEDDGTLSHSKLEMVFALSDPNIDAGRKHLYYISRTSVTSNTWSARARLPFNIDGTSDETPRFSADDKAIFFASNRTGTTGGLDIWITTRPTAGVNSGWSTPTLVPGVNSTVTDKWCMPCSTGRYLMISSRAPSTSEDLYEGVNGGGAPTRVDILSSDQGDTGVMLSADCKTIYFASTRSGTNKIYKSTRATANGTWSAPMPFDDFIATGGAQSDPWISEDQRTFVFASNASGTNDMYITTR